MGILDVQDCAIGAFHFHSVDLGGTIAPQERVLKRTGRSTPMKLTNAAFFICAWGWFGPMKDAKRGFPISTMLDLYQGGLGVENSGLPAMPSTKSAMWTL